MHPQRTSRALRQLDDLGREAPPCRWHWAVAKIQSIGRVALPPEALRALAQRPGGAVELRGRCSRLALILRRDTRGAPFRVDARGRLYLPVWLQRGDAVLVGTTMDPLLVVIAPVGVLDGIGDVLVGEQQ